MDDIKKQYLDLFPQLSQVIVAVQNKLHILPMTGLESEVNFKSFSSIIRKCQNKNTDNIKELSDLVRGRIFFSSQYTFQDVTNLIKNIFNDHIQNISHKNDHDFGLDYHGTIHVDLKINGINFELQLIPSEFKPYKELLHFIYEQFKNHRQLSDYQKQFLRQTHNELYRKLDNQAQNNRKILRKSN